ncbi:MAG: hypothetical protein WKF76_00670 [Nocardioidaceae bacterium]
MATDLAEVLGGALALNLLFDLPLLAGGVHHRAWSRSALLEPADSRATGRSRSRSSGCWRSSWSGSSTAWSREAWTPRAHR